MKIRLLVAASFSLLCLGLLVLSLSSSPTQEHKSATADSKAHQEYAARPSPRPAHREAEPSLSEIDDGWDEMSGEDRTRHLLLSFENAMESLESDSGNASARARAESALTLLRAELLRTESGTLGRDRYNELERRLDALTK